MAIRSQLATNNGMSRMGGAASRGSKAIGGSKGRSFAAMENALLKGGIKSPAQAKRAAKGQPGRQFMTKASGGDMSLSKPRSDVAIKSNPTALRSLQMKGDSGSMPKA